MSKVYLDNAATTKVDDRVVRVMMPYFNQVYGNPSSIHSFGQEAKSAVDEARETLAGFLNCAPEEVIFTSGGSEADNLAIRGLVRELGRQNKESGKLHIIVSAIEHHAILHTVQDLEKSGLIEVSMIKPDSDGLINPKSVIAELKPNTVLVSIMYVNNETGAAQPIREIGELIKAENTQRLAQKAHQVYFHTDAVQAAELFNLDVDWLLVDMLTLTAHKIHGPKGIGALYLKKGTPLHQMISGGSQEYRLRAGTENVPGIVGFAEAVKLAIELKGRDFSPIGLSKSPAVQEVLKLKERLISSLIERIPNTAVNGSKVAASPFTANISFFNAEGEAIILNLDFLGIAVSSGSACTSRSLDPSHVLTAMGIPPEKAHGSIRFSMSRYTNEEEINKVIEVLPPIIEKLRAMSPFKTN